MHKEAFRPPLGQIIQISEFCALAIYTGQGLIEIDFRRYDSLDLSVVFLSPGQYVRILKGHFKMDLFQISAIAIGQMSQSKVLFCHVIGVGHIPLNRCVYRFLLSQSEKRGYSADSSALKFFVQQWLALNPFDATAAVTDTIFKSKQWIDANFKRASRPKSLELASPMSSRQTKNALKRHVGRTYRQLLSEKVLMEAKKALAFSDRPIKRIARDLRFSDPCGFHRFFSRHANATPGAFQERFGNHAEQHLASRFMTLLEEHFRTERSMGFYADKLGVGYQTLRRFVKGTFHVPAGALIRHRLKQEAERLVLKGEPIHRVASALGFQEPHHFSAFFKQSSHFTPSEFRQRQKVPLS